MACITNTFQPIKNYKLVISVNRNIIHIINMMNAYHLVFNQKGGKKLLMESIFKKNEIMIPTHKETSKDDLRFNIPELTRSWSECNQVSLLSLLVEKLGLLALYERKAFLLWCCWGKSQESLLEFSPLLGNYLSQVPRVKRWFLMWVRDVCFSLEKEARGAAVVDFLGVCCWLCQFSKLWESAGF